MENLLLVPLGIFLYYKNPPLIHIKTYLSKVPLVKLSKSSPSNFISLLLITNHERVVYHEDSNVSTSIPLYLPPSYKHEHRKASMCGEVRKFIE